MKPFLPCGMVIPMLTPFQPGGALDEDALRRLTHRLVAAGVHGLFPVGSTGEFYALSWQERCRVIQVVIEENAGRLPVYAGTGGISTLEVITLTQRAEAMGADGVVVVTPFYVTPTQDELYSHYAAIAHSTTLPVIPYINPGRTGGVNLKPRTVARLAEIDNLVAVKDSSGDLAQVTEDIRLAPPGFVVFQGRDDLILDSLKIGAVGGVAATGNVAPELTVELFDAFQAGDLLCAQAAQDKLTLLRGALALGTFPSVLKAAMALLGQSVGDPRGPVSPLSEAQIPRLARVLAQMGLQTAE